MTTLKHTLLHKFRALAEILFALRGVSLKRVGHNSSVRILHGSGSGGIWAALSLQSGQGRGGGAPDRKTGDTTEEQSRGTALSTASGDTEENDERETDVMGNQNKHQFQEKLERSKFAQDKIETFTETSE